MSLTTPRWHFDQRNIMKTHVRCWNRNWSLTLHGFSMIFCYFELDSLLWPLHVLLTDVWYYITCVRIVRMVRTFSTFFTTECTSVQLPWRLFLKMFSNILFVLIGKSLYDCMCQWKYCRWNTANYCDIHANECMLITMQHCVSSYTSRVLSKILNLEGNLYIYIYIWSVVQEGLGAYGITPEILGAPTFILL